jgi:hypothetical protein
MRNPMHRTSHANPPDEGMATLILWIIVFAGFMAALIALESGGHHVTTAREILPSSAGIGPA